MVVIFVVYLVKKYMLYVCSQSVPDCVMRSGSLTRGSNY